MQYVGQNTHPECAYAINACARYCVDPRAVHGTALKRIGRYLKGCLDDGLIISKSKELALDCYVDADFAGNYNKADADDPNSVRSRTGFVITFGSIPVLWKTLIQRDTALSTMESEYIALSTAMRSLLHLRALLDELTCSFDLDLGANVSTISTVFEDNQGCLSLVNVPKMSPRNKYLALKYHFFRTHIGEDKGIVAKYISTKLQKADIFTKGLTGDSFKSIRKLLMGW